MTRVWGVILVALALAPAAVLPRTADPRPIGPTPSHFDHRAHFKSRPKTGCTTATLRAPTPDRRRPAAHDHKACRRRRTATRATFTAPNAQATELCFTCHTGREYWRTQSGVRAFPSQPSLDSPGLVRPSSPQAAPPKGRPRRAKEEGCTFCTRTSAKRRATPSAHTTRPARSATPTPTRKHRCRSAMLANKYKARQKGRLKKTGPVMRSGCACDGCIDHFKHRFDIGAFSWVSVWQTAQASWVMRSAWRVSR